jgi:hypothetical protein
VTIPVAYYNEHDPRAAAWLAELIARGHIAFGLVDTRSIEDITPNDLRGFTQCHFFAGIGVWSYALRRAGWPDHRPVWTGSCPCQPFSAAGKGGGFADERHLWPAWFQLIAQCRPPTVFGEQVASKDGLDWLDLVHADLEAAEYTGGFVDLCAAGVGAPHIRQRLFFGYGLADTGASGLSVREREAVLGTGRWREGRATEQRGGAPVGVVGDTHGVAAGWIAGTVLGAQRSGGHQPDANGPDVSGRVGGLADTNGGHTGAERQQRGGEQRLVTQDGGVGGLADTHGGRAGLGRGTGCESSAGIQRGPVADGCSVLGLVDNTDGRRLERCGAQPEHGQPVEPSAATGPGPTNGFWRDADWLLCRDGKWRPVEPGSFPLAHGAPERVGRLRGFGNAIVAPAAQAFIESYLEVTT